MDYGEDPKCAFLKEVDTSARDFYLLPENKADTTENDTQSSEYVNNADSLTREFDQNCACISSDETKIHSPENTTKMAKNDKGNLSTNSSPPPDDKIDITKQKSQIIKSGVSTYENIVESKSFLANLYHSNNDEITELDDALEKNKKIFVEEKRCGNKKLLLSPEADYLTTCMFTEEKNKYATTEQNISETNKGGKNASFYINSHASNSHISGVLRNRKDESKQNFELTENVLEDKFHSDFNHSVSNKDSITEKELKVTMTEEHHGLLSFTDFTDLHASKHKAIKENGEEREEIIPTKVEIKENVSALIEFKHCDATISVNKEEVFENKLKRSHAEYNKSFPSYISNLDAEIYIEDKKNCKTAEKIISEDKNYNEDLHFLDSGNSDSVRTSKLRKEKNNTDCAAQINQKNDESVYSNIKFSHYGTDHKLHTEKISNKNVIIEDVDSHYSSDFPISETITTKAIIEEKKETNCTISYSDGEWLVISFEDYERIKEAQSKQQEINSETSGKAHEGEKSNEEIFSDTHLEDFEDKKKFKDSLSSLTSCNIFSVSSVSENKTGDRNQTFGVSKKNNRSTLSDSKMHINTESKIKIECKGECKEREEEMEGLYQKFSDDEKEETSSFRDNSDTKANGYEKAKIKPEATENLNLVDTKNGEKILSSKDLHSYKNLNIGVQYNPKNSFDSSASDIVQVFKKHNLTKRHSAVVAKNSAGEIQHKDHQNEKNFHNHLSLNEFEILDRPDPTKMEKNLRTEGNGDSEDIACTNLIHSSNVKCVKRNEKYNITKHIDTRETVSQSCQIGDHDIKTLEDALNCFHLSPLVEELEISLEDVRRHKKSKEAHEMFLKDVDKQIQKLSFKFHPDRIRNKGGSEEEIKTAQKLQTAINAVRTALNILNDAFLEDIDTDHRYGFYTKLKLSSLTNEDEAKSHIYEVLFQIGLLSEIKQEKIVAKIPKFLAESRCCVQSYFDCNICDFEKHRDSALYHLNCCIEGYKKLQNELKVIENECKVEKLENIRCTINRMITENHGSLTLLRDLKKVAKNSLVGSFQIFTTSDTLDEYFTLPFVCYVNVILMCSVMIRNETSRFGINALKSPSFDFQTFKINGISFTHPYLLVSSFIDNEQCKWLFKESMSKKELKQEFDTYLACFDDHLRDTFKESNYSDGSMKNHFSEELKKCTKMMFDFQMKEKELSKNIQKFTRKTEEMDEKYEKIMKQNEEFNKLTKERIEKSKKLAEQTSLALSENF